ncbi:MAG: UDP-N-acetylmuramate--L-alanine ligase [bacterium]
MDKQKIKNKKVHFIGIGGIGVSSLARYFLSQNWTVSGSDVAMSDLVSELRSDGITVHIGHKSANVPRNASLVVYSNAITSDNPELATAYERNFTVQSYPQALGDVTKQYTTIAIAGSHGKSTTTALVALILEKAGLDPTVIIGTKLKEFGNSNFRSGKGKYLVIEADEYKGAFWNYSPNVALITNIDREHLDFYKDLNDVKKSFIKFINNIKPTGRVFINQDNAGIHSIVGKIKVPFSWYGFTENKSRTKKVSSALYLPGLHNVSNALGAFSVAKHIGVSEKVILAVFKEYHGSWRRMEYKGYFAGTKHKVFDDYGHHPTEIQATLSAFRATYPRSPLICVFQPHQVKRLQILFKQFVSAFDNADAVFLFDVYTVAGRDNTSMNDGPTLSEQLSISVSKRKNGPHTVVYLPQSKLLPDLLKEELVTRIYELQHHYVFEKPAIILMMGAGTIVDVTPQLLQQEEKEM